MSTELLQVSWFLLIGVMVVVYTILDGFDLGIGIWYLFTKNEKVRNAMFAAIGPFWDGNEVWLLTAGASIFAAFPPVYATVFSGFYMALMLVLFALIFRAVSIEFWSHTGDNRGKTGWGIAFALGSLLPSLLYGVAIGNILHGIAVDVSGEYIGGFVALLNPYALLIGVLNLVMIAGQGAAWFALKTESELAVLGRKWAQMAFGAYLPLALAVIVITALTQKHLLANYLAVPVLWVLPLLTLVAIVLAIVNSLAQKDLAAFISSSASIALILLTAVSGLFPAMVPSTINPAYTLTIMNSSSTPTTLGLMLGMAAVGLPIVAIYTAWVYKFFSGKVNPEGKYY